MERKFSLSFLLILNLVLLGLTLSSVNFHLVIMPIQPVIAPTIPGTGDINGSVWNDINQNGVFETGESGIEGIQVCARLPVSSNISTSGACTLTDVNGNYTFQDLVPAQYSVTRISVTDLAGNSLVGTTGRSLFVTVVADEVVHNIDFGVVIVIETPSEVTVESVGTDPVTGLPEMSRTTAATFTKDVTDHCGLNQPIEVGFQLEFLDTGVIVRELMTNTGGEIWEVDIDPASFGVAIMTFFVDCPPVDTPSYPFPNTQSPNVEDEFQDGGGVIYLDPSGTILDACNGLPLEGATATLLILTIEGDFIPAPVVSPGIMLPNETTLTTESEGSYRWDVIAGTYKVRAEKAGYVTAESEALVIPPPVTDLDFYLERTGGCPTAGDQLEPLILEVEDLIEKVEHLIETEELTNDQGQFLMTKLDAARDSLNNEKIKAAITKLEGFINRVTMYIQKDVLSSEQGQPLIDGANDIINKIVLF